MRNDAILKRNSDRGQPMPPGHIRNGQGTFPIRPDRTIGPRPSRINDPLGYVLWDPYNSVGQSIAHCLKRAGFKTPDDVAMAHDWDLMGARNFGPKKLAYVRARIPARVSIDEVSLDQAAWMVIA